MLIFSPRQMVLITCRGRFKVVGKEEEKDDILPCTWHMPLSSHPPMYAVAVKADLMAASIIRESGCFVVNFIPFSLVDKVKSAMSISGEYVEKCDAVGFTEHVCEKLIDSFRIKEALGWLECEVVEEKSSGDHVLFIGKVVFSHMERDDKRPFHLEGSDFTTTQY